MPQIEKIVSYLKKEFKVEALILCGSRSVGDYKENSDWDLKAFVKNKSNVRKIPSLDGISNLDCVFFNMLLEESKK